MKRYLTMLVCAALIITSLAFSPFMHKDVIAGKGSGTDSKVTSISELSDVLKFLSGVDNDSSLKNERKDKPTFLNLASEDTETETETEAETSFSTYGGHSSITWHTDDVVSISMVDGGNASHVYETRNYTLYITPDACYYDISLLLTSNDIEMSYAEIDVEAYSNFKTQQSLIRINQFKFLGEKNTRISPSAIGKWLDYSLLSDLGDILNANTENMQDLFAIGKYLGENSETHFDNRNNIYSLKKKYLNSCFDLLGIVHSSDVNKSNFKIDLNNATNPKLYYISDFSETSSSGSTNAYITQNMSFSNIDNTEITLKDVDVLQISFDECFIIEEPQT